MKTHWIQPLYLVCWALWLLGPEPARCQTDAASATIDVHRHGSKGDIVRTPGAPANIERRASEPLPIIPVPSPPHQGLLPLARPDEGPLWDLYRQKREAELDRLISRYRRDYPGWHPPQRLLQLRSIEGTRSQVLQAREHRDWPAIVEVQHREPGLFRCPHADAVWALAEAYSHLGELDAAQSRYRYLIKSCGSPELALASLQKAEQLLDPDRVRQLYTGAATVIRDESWRRRLDTLRYQYERARLNSLLKQGVPMQIDAALTRVSGAIVTRKDPVLARQIGWFYFRERDYTKALPWFRRAHEWQQEEDSAYGLALTMEQLGQYEAAAQLTRDYAAQSPRMGALLGGLELKLAWQALEHGHLDESQAKLDQARRYGAEDEQTRTVQAWLDLSRGQSVRAAGAFESLYRAHPNSDYARGLAASSQSAPFSSLERLREEYSDPLDQQIAPILADTAYRRKRFLYAHAVDPHRRDALHHIDSPYVELGGMFRHKSGEGGMDRLDLWHAPSLRAATVFKGVHALSLTISQVGLDSGKPKPCAPIGSLPLQLPCVGPDVGVTARNDTLFVSTGQALEQTPTHRLSGSRSFELSYHRDGWTSPFLSIGVTPTDAVIDARPTFRLGLRQERAAGYWQIQLLSQPVRDSILSYTGIVDPYSSHKWGRVLRSGLEWSASRPLKGHWSVYTTLHAAVLEGKQVKQNWTAGTSLGLGYDLELQGFDYFSVGPSVSYQHYDNNQNHFTLGHGGYFSPQQFINIGPAVDFLTTEGRPFILRGRLSAGLQYYREDESPWFPKGLDGISGRNTRIDLDGDTFFLGEPVYTDNDELGPSYHVEVKGAWLFHPNWQLGGGVALRKTNGYEDYTVGAFLRLYFDSRHDLVSSDIPAELFQSVY